VAARRVSGRGAEGARGGTPGSCLNERERDAAQQPQRRIKGREQSAAAAPRPEDGEHTQRRTVARAVHDLVVLNDRLPVVVDLEEAVVPPDRVEPHREAHAVPRAARPVEGPFPKADPVLPVALGAGVVRARRGPRAAGRVEGAEVGGLHALRDVHVRLPRAVLLHAHAHGEAADVARLGAAAAAAPVGRAAAEAGQLPALVEVKVLGEVDLVLERGAEARDRPRRRRRVGLEGVRKGERAARDRVAGRPGRECSGGRGR
jgi:hypothetical protein